MRVSVFIDGVNLYDTQQQLNWAIDFAKILGYCSGFGEIVKATYYAGADSPMVVKDQAFLKELTEAGYCVRIKDVKIMTLSDLSVHQRTNHHMDIVLDMFNTVEDYDIAVLIGGDGDFERAVRELKARGKEVKVLSTAMFIAPEMLGISGIEYIDMAELRGVLA